RYETVVSRIAHRRVEEPIDDQRPRGLVHLVLDGLTADGHLDHDVHFARWIPAHRDCLQTHPYSCFQTDSLRKHKASAPGHTVPSGVPCWMDARRRAS